MTETSISFSKTSLLKSGRSLKISSKVSSTESPACSAGGMPTISRLFKIVQDCSHGDIDLMIVMYKILNGFVRIDSKQLLSLRTDTRTRGHDSKIFKEHATKLCRINNFTQKSTNDWNSLPLKVISAASLNIFKNQLDIHWSNYQFAIPTTS